MLSQRDICAKANQYFDLCVSSDYAREQRLVHVIADPNVIQAFENSTSLMGQQTTIKLEGFETFDRDVWDWCRLQANAYKHHGRVSAHVFMAPAGGYTFKPHTDPDDVLIYVVEGEKGMVVETTVYDLKAGDSLFIPANTPHYAVNNKASIMVSLGLEKWMVDKL